MTSQTLPKSKSNKSFMILSALGILFVVDRHAGDAVGLFISVFPYGSFFMPLFMFISGYFWKEKSLESWHSTGAYLLRKLKHLMVPYLLWAAFYGVLTLLLNRVGMNLPQPSIRNLIYSIGTDGTTFGINGAAWFVPTLFVVTAGYTVLRKLLGRAWNDLAAMAAFVLLGAATVALVTGSGVYYKALHLYKAAFFIQFFQLGQVFHRYLERWFDRVNGLGLCLCMALVNMLLQARYGDLDMGVLSVMNGFSYGNCIVPLITSVTGIFFWLKIAKFLEPVLGASSLVNYISDHTFFIMMHHMLFFNAFSALLWNLPGFDAAAFRADPWYLYKPKPWFTVAYFLFSITATLLFSRLFDRLAGKLKRT